MASFQKEIFTTASPEFAWDAIIDVGALHTRLVRGFVVDTKLEPGARIVTFANGMIAKELIVNRDDTRHRLVWAAVGGRLTHHNASVQVYPGSNGGSRIVWTADWLPDDLTAAITSMIEQALAAMKATLDATATKAPA